MPVIIPMQERHVPLLAARVLPAERAEAAALSPLPYEEALRRTLRATPDAVCVMEGGVPLLAFGAARRSYISLEAAPWCAVTEEARKRRVRLLRDARRVVAGWRRRYALLRNVVSVDNVPAVRWLRWLGFTMDEPRPYGRDGELFHEFRMDGDVS